MDEDIELVKRIYACFNERNIDGVLAALTDDVDWANGMDGGHVHGHDAVRAYWQRQWSVVRPRVEPQTIGRGAASDTIVVEVRQSLFQLDGAPLQGSAKGLKTSIVRHLFRIRDGRVSRFDIEDDEVAAT